MTLRGAGMTGVGAEGGGYRGKRVTLTGRILIGNLVIICLQTQSMKGVKYADIEGI
jgi:hypothetical protein